MCFERAADGKRAGDLLLGVVMEAVEEWSAAVVLPFSNPVSVVWKRREEELKGRRRRRGYDALK